MGFAITLVIIVIIVCGIVYKGKWDSCQKTIASSKPTAPAFHKVVCGDDNKITQTIAESFNSYATASNAVLYLEKVKQWHIDRAAAYKFCFQKKASVEELSKAEIVQKEIDAKKRENAYLMRFPKYYCPIGSRSAIDAGFGEKELSMFSKDTSGNNVSVYFQEPYCLTDSNGRKLLFFTHFIVAIQNNALFVFKYQNISADTTTSTEYLGYVPPSYDDEIASRSWLHERRDGGPDRRYNYNPSTTRVYRGTTCVTLISYNKFSFSASVKFSNRSKSYDFTEKVNALKVPSKYSSAIDFLFKQTSLLTITEVQALANAENERRKAEAKIREDEQRKARELAETKRKQDEAKRRAEREATEKESRKKREEEERIKLEEALRLERERQAAEEAERKRKAEELALRRKQEAEERRKELEARRAEEERVKRELAEKQERERQERLYEINKAKNTQYEIREDMPLYMYLDIPEPENTSTTLCNSLNFKPRFLNALREHNCNNMYSLLSYSLADLISWDNLGRVTITHAIQEIERFYKGVVTFEAPEQTRVSTRNRSRGNSSQFSDEEIRMIMEARRQKEAERERQEAEAKERALKLLTKEVTTSPIIQHGGSNVITNNIFNLTFVQKDIVEATLYELVFVSELGDEVSLKVECRVVKQGETFNAYFELLPNMSFDSSKVYYLLIKNKGDDSLIGKLDYKIDISFASDFDF